MNDAPNQPGDRGEPPESGEPPDSRPVDAFLGLLRKAQSGDAQAVGELLDRYRDYMMAIANSQLESGIRPKIAPSDVVQQSLIAIQGSLDAFQGRTASEFRAWVRQILSNDLSDARRKYRNTRQRAVSREHSLDDSGLVHPAVRDLQPTPATNVRAQEESALLRAALSQLPDRYQRVLHLRNWNEMSFESIGNHMDCSADAARKLWLRAIQSLKTQLNKSKGPLE